MVKPNFESNEWADVVPIPQDEGGEMPLAAIAYPDQYVQAMSYLRAVMAADEASMRVLDLTEHIISINPAHYTVWLYRANVLERLNMPPLDELNWLDAISFKHLKNYQIWHHRHVIMSRLSSLPHAEVKFLAKVLDKDAKNYHAWSYRQWLVKQFGLWPSTATGSDSDTELGYTEKLLHNDVRNNSAWNHRFFVVFGDPRFEGPASEAIDREIAFTQEKIREAPQNQSPWNYLKGVLKKGERSKSSIESFALEFANPEKDVDDVRSSHALDLLASIWTESRESQKAARALDLLAHRYDPIRRNYWEWRKGMLGQDVSTA